MLVKALIRPIYNLIIQERFNQKWRRLNAHNSTIPGNIFPIDRVKVGKDTYGLITARTYNNPNEKLLIGSFCSIAGDVEFILSGEHPYKGISTFPFKVKYRGDKYEAECKGPIIVEDDVWIGQRALILSGVKIGKGAIIAAGSVVTQNIPPYAIFAGNKISKYRFDDDIIKILIKTDLNKLSKKEIQMNVDEIYQEINSSNIDGKFIKSLIDD